MPRRRPRPESDDLFSVPAESPALAEPGEGATDWRLVEAVLASPSVRTLFLHGPPGLGKTWCAYHLGRTDRGVFAVTLTEETPSAELRGHFLPKGDGFEWHDGPCTLAMRRGARLVLNEVSHAGADTFSFLHPILESAGTARLTLPTNETVVPAEGFHVVCTDNAPPEDLPPALRDRFDGSIAVLDPHPAALAALEEPFRSAAVRCARLEEERRISLRGWFSLQTLTVEMGLETACRAVFGEERGARVHDALRLHAGKAAGEGGLP